MSLQKKLTWSTYKIQARSSKQMQETDSQKQYRNALFIVEFKLQLFTQRDANTRREEEMERTRTRSAAHRPVNCFPDYSGKPDRRPVCNQKPRESASVWLSRNAIRGFHIARRLDSDDGDGDGDNDDVVKRTTLFTLLYLVYTGCNRIDSPNLNYV